MKSTFPWFRWAFLTAFMAIIAVLLQYTSVSQINQSINQSFNHLIDAYHEHHTILSQPLNQSSVTAKSVSPVNLTGYVVLIDGGSSGTRVHIHRYSIDSVNESNLPVIFPSMSLKVKPGLSSFIDPSTDQPINPSTNQSIADSLQPLIDFAHEHVPLIDQKNTHIYLFATAGLRVLPIHQAESILGACRDALSHSGFAYDAANVRMISGVQEGINGWIAANYLLGNFNQSNHQSNNQSTSHSSAPSINPSNLVSLNQSISTVGVLEMGGASFQLTYAPNRWSNQSMHQLIDLSIGHQSFKVFTMSYLNFGLEKAQELYHDIVHQSINPQSDQSDDQSINQPVIDPCYPRGLNQSNSLIGSNWLAHHHSHGHYDQCAQLVDRLIRHDLTVNHPITETFDHTINQPIDMSIDHSQVDEWENPSLNPSLDPSNDNDTAHHEPGHLVDCSINQCAFNQSFIPSIDASEHFIAIENFFYTAEFFGLINRTIHQSVDLDLQSIKEKGREFCQLDWATIQSIHQSEPLMDLEKYCFSSVYLPRVIEVGLGLIDFSDISINHSINQSIDGFAIDIDESIKTGEVPVIQSHTHASIHVDTSSDQSTLSDEKSVSQSTNQSINQSMNQSINRLNVRITREINGAAIDWALGAVLLEITNHIHADLFHFQPHD